MGLIGQHWRKARTQRVDSAIAVKVGSFEPGRIEKERDKETGSWGTSPSPAFHMGDSNASVLSGCPVS